jgi:molybdopterin synthase sulfur carrier subunit
MSSGPVGASAMSSGPAGAAGMSSGPVGASAMSSGPAGAAGMSGGPVGASAMSSGPAGAAGMSGGPVGASAMSSGPAGAAGMSSGPVGASAMSSGAAGAAGAGVHVTVRYWASARAAAGCDSEHFTGHHLGDVLEAASAAHTGLGVVLGVSTILLDGRQITAAEPLSEGITLEVLPPFAGG